MMQATFIVVDEHTRGDMHRIDENQSLLDVTFHDALFHVRREVDNPTRVGILNQSSLR